MKKSEIKKINKKPLTQVSIEESSHLTPKRFKKYVALQQQLLYQNRYAKELTLLKTSIKKVVSSKKQISSLIKEHDTAKLQIQSVLEKIDYFNLESTLEKHFTKKEQEVFLLPFNSFVVREKTIDPSPAVTTTPPKTPKPTNVVSIPPTQVPPSVAPSIPKDNLINDPHFQTSNSPTPQLSTVPPSSPKTPKTDIPPIPQEVLNVSDESDLEDVFLVSSATEQISPMGKSWVESSLSLIENQKYKTIVVPNSKSSITSKGSEILDNPNMFPTAITEEIRDSELPAYLDVDSANIIAKRKKVLRDFKNSSDSDKVKGFLNETPDNQIRLLKNNADFFISFFTTQVERAEASSNITSNTYKPEMMARLCTKLEKWLETFIKNQELASKELKEKQTQPKKVKKKVIKSEIVPPWEEEELKLTTLAISEFGAVHQDHSRVSFELSKDELKVVWKSILNLYGTWKSKPKTHPKNIESIQFTTKRRYASSGKYHLLVWLKNTFNPHEINKSLPDLVKILGPDLLKQINQKSNKSDHFLTIRTNYELKEQIQLDPFAIQYSEQRNELELGIYYNDFNRLLDKLSKPRLSDEEFSHLYKQGKPRSNINFVDLATEEKGIWFLNFWVLPPKVRSSGKIQPTDYVSVSLIRHSFASNAPGTVEEFFFDHITSYSDEQLEAIGSTKESLSEFTTYSMEDVGAKISLEVSDEYIIVQNTNDAKTFLDSIQVPEEQSNHYLSVVDLIKTIEPNRRSYKLQKLAATLGKKLTPQSSSLSRLMIMYAIVKEWWLSKEAELLKRELTKAGKSDEEIIKLIGTINAERASLKDRLRAKSSTTETVDFTSDQFTDTKEAENE